MNLQSVSWILTSPFTTNMAISEKRFCTHCLILIAIMRLLLVAPPLKISPVWRLMVDFRLVRLGL